MPIPETKAATLTHGHPNGGLTAGAFVSMLARVVNGTTLEDGGSNPPAPTRVLFGAVE